MHQKKQINFCSKLSSTTYLDEIKVLKVLYRSDEKLPSIFIKRKKVIYKKFSMKDFHLIKD